MGAHDYYHIVSGGGKLRFFFASYYFMSLILSVFFLSFPAHAQETAPGDVCTAGETNYIRQVGGPETSGVVHLMRCDGMSWQQYLTTDANGNLGIGIDDMSGLTGDRIIALGAPGTDTAAVLYMQGNQQGSDGAFAALLGYNDTVEMGGIELVRSGADNTSSLNIYTSNAGVLSRRIRFHSNGGVAIGEHVPQAALDVVGDIFYSGVLRDVSDKREKKNVKLLSDSLEKINHLQGVSFVMKNDEKHRQELGFIAQDVQKVFPNLVDVTRDGRMGLSYTGFIAPMVEAIKELNAKNTALENENEDMRKIIHKLNARMDIIEGKRRPLLKPYND